LFVSKIFYLFSDFYMVYFYVFRIFSRVNLSFKHIFFVFKNNYLLFFLFFVFLRITKGRFYEKHKNAPHQLIKLTSSMYVYE